MNPIIPLENVGGDAQGTPRGISAGFAIGKPTDAPANRAQCRSDARDPPTANSTQTTGNPTGAQAYMRKTVRHITSVRRSAQRQVSDRLRIGSL